MKEPKFKVGQVLKYSFKATVMEIDDDGYHCDNAYIPFTAESMWELSEEHASEDLEEAAQRYNENMSWCWEVPEYPHLEAFKAGAQWQKRKDQETIELAEDHAMLAGMEKMREEMMKNAVEGEYWIGEIHLDIPIIQGYDDGDRIKFIPIKNEQQ